MTSNSANSCIQEKLKIIATCDEQLGVFFHPFGMRLLETAKSCVGWPTPTRILALFKSLNSRQNTKAIAMPLIEVLDYYAKNAGVDLISIEIGKDGMAENEVRLGFACLPWRNLLQSELRPSQPANCERSWTRSQRDRTQRETERSCS